MKKKKILKILMILMLFTPLTINASDYILCGNNKKIPTVFGTIISTIYIILKIIVPILLVGSGIITFVKVIMDNKVDESLDKAKKKIIRNIIAAILIFFSVSITNTIISLAAGRNNSFSKCTYCMIHPSKCEQKNNQVSKICPGLISDQDKYNEDCTLKNPDEKGNRIDYTTGNAGTTEYVSTRSSISGGAIARTLSDNPNALTNQNIITKTDVPSGYSYYVYVPKKVDNPSAPPLIVYLHGNGKEVGRGYDRMVNGFGFAKYIDQGMEFNTYILMPQKQTKGSWNVEAIKRMIDTEIAAYNIDKNRISIWGYSAGAESAPDVINAYPNTFASAVILAKGYNDPITGFNGVSTYGFYGTKDSYSNTVTPNFIKKLQNAGHTAYIKAYEGVDHDHVMENLIVDQNIGNGFTNIMDWVLNQRRN